MTGYDRVAQAEADAARTYVPEGRTWAGTLACCLAHHRDMFWQGVWGYWVHSAGMRPCEAMAGEPDPELLPCRYCGVQLQPGGDGRMWSLVPKADRDSGWESWTEYAWRPPRTHYRWRDDAWTEKCPVSPTFRHEVKSLRFTGVK